MAASDLLLKDQSATPAAFAPESTDQGTNPAGIAIKRTMFGSADGAQVTLGAKADAVWDGVAAAPSLMSVWKAGVARLLGIGGTTVAVALPASVVGTGTLAQDASLTTLLNKMEAVRALLAAARAIEGLFVTNGTTVYVRRETANADGTYTVSYENMDGTAATPTGTLTPYAAAASGGTSTTKLGDPVYYDVYAAATGIAVGDVVSRLEVYDTSAATATSVWLNLTQGTTLSTAPIPGTNVVEQTKNLVVPGVMLDTTGQAFVTQLKALLTVDTVVKGMATSRSLIIPVKAASAGVAAGGSGYAVGDTITDAAGVFVVSAVTSGAVTAVTVQSANNLTALPASPLAQTATSGTGTGATLTPVYASVAVQLAAANTSRRGLNLQSQGSVAYMSGLATATVDQNSLKIPADALYQTDPQFVGTGAISIISSAAIPVPVYAREF